MDTNHIYPFTSGEQLKKVCSQMDISYQIENITSSMLLAANDVKEFISEEVWDYLMEYFNTGVFETPAEENNDPIKDQAFRLFRLAHGNFTLLHHMPFLSVNISSGGITTKKGDQETTAFKYQTDAIEAKFRQAAWSATGELLDYLTKKSTPWTVWTKDTDWLIDQHVFNVDKYYKANAAFTSGAEFNADNWTEVPQAEMVFLDWTKSVQFTELQALIFDGFRDFDKYYGIDRDAVFYQRIRHIIADVTDDHLRGRLTIANAKEYELKLAKKAVAYYSIAEAVLQFDLSVMPSPIRLTIANEHQGRGTEKNLMLKKENLANLYKRIGEDFLYKLDHELASNAATTDEEKSEVFENFEQTFDADDKSIVMM